MVNFTLTPATTGGGKGTDSAVKKNEKTSRFRTPEENSMSVLLKIFLFVMSSLKTMEGFVSVYLVVVNKWTPLKASWIRFTRDMFCLIVQPFLGHYIDETRDKKLLLVVCGVVPIVAGIIMMTTTNFIALIFKGILDGMEKSLLLSVVTAMTLGAVGKIRFHRKHAAVNNMVKNVGNGLGAILTGGIAYAIYPNLKYSFALFVGTGVLSLAVVVMMPKEGEAINQEVARGQSIIFTRFKNIFGEDNESDDELDEKIGEKSARKKAQDFEENPVNQEANDDKGRKESKMRQIFKGGMSDEVKATPKMSMKEMLSDPTRSRSLIFLFLVFFSYHLVNATVIPLLGQYLGLKDEDAIGTTRDTLPIVSGLTLIGAVGGFSMNWYLKANLRNLNYRTVLLVGCGALTLRLLLIIILMKFTDNLWAIGSTNVLDGIGVGCLDLMLALYSHLLSRQTGHYNLNMAIISTAKEIGSSVSMLLGGALATYTTYETTFIVLTAMMIFPILFSFGISTPSLYGLVKKEEPVYEHESMFPIPSGGVQEDFQVDPNTRTS